MPYIPKDRAFEIIAGLRSTGELPDDVAPGDLTWLLSEMAARYIEKRGISYRVLNDVTGALENTKAEVREHVTEPYEAEKRADQANANPWDRLRDPVSR